MQGNVCLSVATPKAINGLPALPPSFFARPAAVVAPELISCLLVKRQPSGELLRGVIVETEAYSQHEPACHGYRRRSPSNETLFGEPGRFYVYVSYGIHYCVHVVFVGYSPALHLLTAISMGNNDNKPAEAASGALVAELWGRYMQAVAGQGQARG